MCWRHVAGAVEGISQDRLRRSFVVHTSCNHVCGSGAVSPVREWRHITRNRNISWRALGGANTALGGVGRRARTGASGGSIG